MNQLPSKAKAATTILINAIPIFPALTDGGIAFLHVRDGLHDEDARLDGGPDHAAVQGQPRREAQRWIHAIHCRVGQQVTN